MFSNNQTTFRSKINYSREYTMGTSTDGLEEEEEKKSKQEDVILNGNDLEKAEHSGDMEIELSPVPDEKPAEEFISVPKTTSFRASLRKRNAMLSSDDSDSDESKRSSEDELPRYTADYDDEIATTGYATNPNQFRSSNPKKHHVHSHSHKQEIPEDPELPISNPTPLWEADDLSASTSDEEAKWEQSLLQRATAGPKVQRSVVTNIVAGKPTSEQTDCIYEWVIK